MFISILVSLSPVFLFLLVLVIFDSYRLLKFSFLLKIIIGGCLAAGVSLVIEYLIEIVFKMPVTNLSIYIAPPLEELLKATIVIILFYKKRVGFLVDAAIIGFAIGAGFSLVENSLYLSFLTHESIGTWILRGFGTAIMHGSTTCLTAIISGYILEKHKAAKLTYFIPGLLLAIIFHIGFNLFILPPALMTLLLLIFFSTVILFVFQRSEKGLEKWLEGGFSNDILLLKTIDGGTFRESNSGKYLYSLQEILPKEIVGDMLCYLKIHLELAIKAKSMLMLKETGYPVKIDLSTSEKFKELKYLEKNIGHAGLSALKPLLHCSDKDLWQIYFLKKQNHL